MKSFFCLLYYNLLAPRRELHRSCFANPRLLNPTPQALVPNSRPACAGFKVYGPRICGIWGSYYNVSKAIFYLLKGDYRA